ncbi:ferritin-like domain-containing protein [Sorangium sp. So ce1182]|uniref:ferritin-like domain-containing protein n=1 Tax=Sorangium sp. So ce1182 TaxID=3133334 RepID=UPI003F60001A
MNALLIKAVSPIVWRIPGHDARKLFGFARAEQGSRIDLEAAARLTSSSERRAAYVRHLLDEGRHAQMFSLRSAELRRKAGKEPYGVPRADTDDLFERLGEVRFLAFVHRGEGRGRRQFEVYRDWFGRRGDDRTRALFDAILKDERRHEAYTWELLVELAGGRAEARAELRRATAWEAWRTWRRAGRFLAERVYFALMAALYLLLLPFALIARVVKPVSHGWVMPPLEAELSRPRAEARTPALPRRRPANP